MQNHKPKTLLALLLLGLVFTSMVTAPPRGMLPVYAVDAILAISVIITGGRIPQDLECYLAWIHSRTHLL